MTTWILTVGNSDVLLDITKTIWHSLMRKAQARGKNTGNPAESKVKIPGGKEFVSYPARAVGLVCADQLEEASSYLRFPRFDALLEKIKECHQLPKQIIVILTNQEQIFNSSHRKPDSPYWQDTCTLELILRHYLEQKLPQAQQHFLTVQPDPGMPGLDHWEKTLDLIQLLLAGVQCRPRKPVYVSHQAGTPALSSAVQFVCLTKFGPQVQFVVSNEYKENSSELISSSTYLRGIRLQEAKRLLERYDYAGVQELLKEDLQTLQHPTARRIEQLLEAAILWNKAQFQAFGEHMGEELRSHTQQWWWTGYESAYLAVIRLEQGNTVEALFHSFRAAEGMISDWAKWYYPDDIKETNSGAPMVKRLPNSKLPNYLLEELKEKKGDLLLYSDRLFKLFRHSRPDVVDYEDVKVIWKETKNIRNQQFHRLLGLHEKDIFRAWHTRENRRDWKLRLRNCLNAIAKQTFDSLEEASLMDNVHKELKDAIIAYQNWSG